MALIEENNARVVAYLVVLVVGLAGLHCLAIVTRRYLLRPIWERTLAALPPY